MCLGNSITDQSQRRINSEYVSLPDIRDESSGWTRNVSQESFSDSFSDLFYALYIDQIRKTSSINWTNPPSSREGVNPN